MEFSEFMLFELELGAQSFHIALQIGLSATLLFRMLFNSFQRLLLLQTQLSLHLTVSIFQDLDLSVLGKLGILQLHQLSYVHKQHKISFTNINLLI